MVSEAKAMQSVRTRFGHGRTRIAARVSHPIRGRRLYAKSMKPEEIGVPVFTATWLSPSWPSPPAPRGHSQLPTSQLVLAPRQVGVSESWKTTLGTFNAAAALGLLFGLISVPPVGTAAAVGLILYFVGAIITPCAPAITDRPGGRVPRARRGRAGTGIGLVSRAW